MLAPLGLAGLIVLGAAIYYEVRSALIGIALSNGIEVLVDRPTYREIVQYYRTDDELDDCRRWDNAILETLRLKRPNEWRYLARSLGYQIAGKGSAVGARRLRQLANR